MNETKYVQIIDSFITKEQEAEKFYRTLAVSVEREKTRELLNRMANEEAGHADVLEKFKAKPVENFQFLPPEVDMGLSTTIEQVKLSKTLTAEDVLKIAIKKEEEAAIYYESFRKQLMDPELIKICEQMINMEKLHKYRLEDEYLTFLLEIRGILDLPEIKLTLKDLL